MDDYTPADRERRVDEPPKRGQLVEASGGRGAFGRDRARVLHSYAFRRLADKTQVVEPGQDDFPRTRLTHSLEVAQIGREMGAALGCDPDLVDAAGLAHDLGHPPFGHNGEQALDEVAQPAGGFEGNAQTLRILTRLEAKVVAPDGSPAGLNLTRAALDAACKYPWPRRPDTAKFGVYADDRPAFDWLRAGRPDGPRCLEAQVMDWADDVAYSVHDLEDGVHAGHVRLAQLDADARAQLCRLAAGSYSPWPAQRLAPVLDELLATPALLDVARYDRSWAAQAAVKRATSELTGRFVGAAVAATREAHGPAPLRRYDASLVVPERRAAECALLKAVALRYVMRRPGVAQRQATQRRVLRELVEHLYDTAPSGLESVAAQAWNEAADDAGRLRAVVDQVAALTDSSAHLRHRLLGGATAGARDGCGQAPDRPDAPLH